MSGRWVRAMGAPGHSHDCAFSLLGARHDCTCAAPVPPAVPPDEEAARKRMFNALYGRCGFGEYDWFVVTLDAYAAAVRASAITHAVNALTEPQLRAVWNEGEAWADADPYFDEPAFRAALLRALTGGAA